MDMFESLCIHGKFSGCSTCALVDMNGPGANLERQTARNAMPMGVHERAGTREQAASMAVALHGDLWQTTHRRGTESFVSRRTAMKAALLVSGHVLTWRFEGNHLLNHGTPQLQDLGRTLLQSAEKFAEQRTLVPHATELGAPTEIDLVELRQLLEKAQTADVLKLLERWSVKRLGDAMRARGVVPGAVLSSPRDQLKDLEVARYSDRIAYAARYVLAAHVGDDVRLEDLEAEGYGTCDGPGHTLIGIADKDGRAWVLSDPERQVADIAASCGDNKCHRLVAASDRRCVEHR